MRHTFRNLAGLALVLTLTACTQESQNKIGRSIQNWTGTDGIIEIYAANLNGKTDNGEKKVYFEFSDYSTSYIFYENPN